MKLHEKLTLAAEQKGLSDRKIAELMGGISPSTVGRWKSGTSVPNVVDGYRLATILKADIAYLVDENVDEPPAPEFTADEMELIASVRRLKGGADEAMYRLMNYAGDPYRARSGEVEASGSITLPSKDEKPKRGTRRA